MLIFKALHILSMFTAVMMLVGEPTFAMIAIWRGDVRALAALKRVVGRRPFVGALTFLVGVGFGLLTAFTGGFNLFGGWLIAAYVMIVVLLAISGLPVVQKGYLGLVDRSVEAEAGQRSVDEVARDMAAFRRKFVLVVVANWVLFALIILDMVLKPF
jgi:hypothetical protein